MARAIRVLFLRCWQAIKQHDKRQKEFNRDDDGDRKRGGLRAEGALVLIHVCYSAKSNSISAVTIYWITLALEKTSSRCHGGFLFQPTNDKNSAKIGASDTQAWRSTDSEEKCQIIQLAVCFCQSKHIWLNYPKVTVNLKQMWSFIKEVITSRRVVSRVMASDF